MSSVLLGFETPSTSVNASLGIPQCDCSSLVVEPTNESLEKHFGEQMKDFGQSKGYRSVSVLLLSWEGSDLNTNGKVDKEARSS